MSERLMQNSEVPLRETHKVSIGRLYLDRMNPRLIGLGAGVTEERIIAQLYRSEELSELLQSISANGYLDIEPLIVEQDQNGNLIVLEGNRRLAAIRLFREPDLLDKIRTSEQLNISVPELPEEYRPTLDSVSVYRVPSREDARSFIGFKHINGAAKWESYAKAKFAAEWFRSGSADLEEIAQKIGDKHDTIKRMVAAIYVLDQAEAEEVFSVDDRFAAKFHFSHLYTALSRSHYMEFLGVDIAWSQYEPSPNPIPRNKLKSLKEVLVWIYGSKEDGMKPVVESQNPDIKRLGEVLCSTEGLHVLRAGRSLDEAYVSAQPADEKLSSAIIRARSILREASHNLRGYNGQDESLLNIAEDVSETAQTLYNRMHQKFKSAMGKDL
ncbi:hypothetical protein Selin_2304 [Desulfurispirillum indicum S5]|uniref:Uncharacterized protein n=1 Tax=Desulfurispirillum indicum (strain ATCC BAA-1389 / DSM 22839 / S5) TaxID=653733 RepID=E6W456_DESIS|nr:ParB/Srx family N-terminal domain-containing protein [Desulfurispirillum indicum]ADU67020.1 hypothetical protein Selin_2304 [Desulfurispirillum indicum S5]